MYSRFGHNLKELSTTHCGGKMWQNTAVSHLILLGAPTEHRRPALPKRCNVLLNVLVECLFAHTELPALCTFGYPSVFLNVHTWSYRRFFFTSVQCLLQTTVLPQHLCSTEMDTGPLQNVFPLLLPCLTPRGTVSQHNTAKKQQQHYGWEQWQNSKRVSISVNPVSWLTFHLSVFFLL